jgi:gamma-glutamyltranspeptidase
MTIEASRFSQEVLDSLVAMGYTIGNVGEFNMAVGGIAVIYVDRQANVVFGGADPRRNYRALAY